MYNPRGLWTKFVKNITEVYTKTVGFTTEITIPPHKPHLISCVRVKTSLHNNVKQVYKTQIYWNLLHLYYRLLLLNGFLHPRGFRNAGAGRLFCTKPNSRWVLIVERISIPSRWQILIAKNQNKRAICDYYASKRLCKRYIGPFNESIFTDLYTRMIFFVPMFILEHWGL